MCACAVGSCGCCFFLFFFLVSILQVKKARWREMFLLSCALLLPVFGGVWVCQDCYSLYVDLAFFCCVSVASWLQWQSKRRVRKEKGEMADDQLCGQGWFTAYSKCAWFRRSLIWLAWHKNWLAQGLFFSPPRVLIGSYFVVWRNHVFFSALES